MTVTRTYKCRNRCARRTQRVENSRDNFTAIRCPKCGGLSIRTT